MRVRSAALLVALLASVAPLHLTPAAHAHVVTFAQDTGGEEESQNQEGQNQGGGEGQSDPDAESGAGAGETEGAATEEGPPWTYQMARLGIVLVLLMALGLGALYYRYIVVRQRGEV